MANSVTTSPPDADAACERTILHISDLHFGPKFIKSKWDDLKLEAAKAAPDLILITGDFVNTPWRWIWSDVRQKLEGLKEEIPRPANKPQTRILAVRGNHDTRILGILPVTWLPWIALAILISVLPLLCYREYSAPTIPPLIDTLLKAGIGIGAFLAFAVLCVRCLVSIHPERTLGNMWLTKATYYPELKFGVVPFDSASSGLSAARGKVTKDDLEHAKDGLEHAREHNGLPPNGGLWIAAVHHHPLPLPYDSSLQPLMAMKNAGAFLRELARYGVRIVLHGHRHHQHFFRIGIDPVTSGETEIAVLSGGTPTEVPALGFRHGFNVIRIHSDDHITVEPFEAEPQGGTFSPKEPYEMFSREQHARSRFARQQQEYDMTCHRMVCIAEINDYGDANFVREFRGVTTRLGQLAAFPSALHAYVSRGSIEGLHADSLSAHGPGVQLIPHFDKGSHEENGRERRNKARCEVRFKGAGLQCGESPIDITTEFHGNNAFALDRWRFDSMYPDRGDYLEYVSFQAPPGVALKELVLHVQFPGTIELPKRLAITSAVDNGGQERHWESFRTETLVRLESQNAVGARIRYPVPGTAYRIEWDLPEAEQAPTEPAVDQAVTEALALRKWFATKHDDDFLKALSGVLDKTAGWLRGKLVSVDSSDQKLNYAFFCYDAEKRELRTIASNYHQGDGRRDGVFPYGLGLPGRAFKMAELAVFSRPHDWESGRALGYTTGSAEQGADKPFIPETTALAIPLVPREAPDWPYAVLQISTDEPTVHLHTADSPTTKLLEKVTGGLQETLMTVFLDILSKSPHQ